MGHLRRLEKELFVLREGKENKKWFDVEDYSRGSPCEGSNWNSMQFCVQRSKISGRAVRKAEASMR